MKVRFFNPGLGYSKIKDKVLPEIDRILSEGSLILRQDGEELEKELAKFCGTKYAVMLNSGTDALYLALLAHGIGKGDEVLVPSHTFVATAQVVQQLGATPILYDMDGNFTVSENTKAIMVAHIAGEFCANMKVVEEIANARGLIVIEDACQSIGATQDGEMPGTHSVAACYSHYPAKILGCYGDGGSLVTNDEWLAREVKDLANHYKSDYSKWGINSRLDNIQAVVLREKLRHLPETLKRRAEVAEMYKELKGVGLPRYTKGRVWQDYIIQTPKRDELYAYLKEKGIETMKNEYPFPILKGPLSLGYESETLRIPCNELLTDEEVKYIIETINAFN
jgi:dTDP-4-amino-4,6-dideoxygalactose transaminase